MLSRTADSLFWLARYVERAENTARLIEMGRWMRTIPSEAASTGTWPSIMAAAGLSQMAPQTIGDQRKAIVYLLMDPANPSSVFSCFEQARANARAARAALTVEMWEAVNDAWIELRSLSPDRLENGAMSPLLEWIRQRGTLLRGAAESTALRNDGYDFLSLGFFIERLDNTARLIDVNAAAASGSSQPDAEDDPTLWIATLRAAGVLRAYHAVCKADYQPESILDFLMLNPSCPRSLMHCADRLNDHLDSLARHYGRREGCHLAVQEISGRLKEASVEAILDEGLHAFVSELIRRNNVLAMSIAEAYYFAPPPVAEPSRGRVDEQVQDTAQPSDTLVKTAAKPEKFIAPRPSGVQAAQFAGPVVAAE